MRTLRGAHSYFQALCFIKKHLGEENQLDEALIAEEAAKKFQLVLAHQTFLQHYETLRSDIDIFWKLFPQLEVGCASCDHCLTLLKIVIPWEYESNATDKGEHQKLQSVVKYMKENHQIDLSHMDPRTSYASLCLRNQRQALILPRRYRLTVGSTQGKAANQRNAMQFAHGEVIQSLDCNQDAFAGETLKMPLLLKEIFHEDGSVRFRILGFAEDTFTRSLSLVGKLHGHQEWTFSTLCQRVYAFLGVRMHYGHPDLFEGGWAYSRGGLSKASPQINLSEDIFAGYEVQIREERVGHIEGIVRFEKGRETNLAGVSKFEAKISEGAASILRSRDFFEMMTRWNSVKQFMMFHSSVGHFINNSVFICASSLYTISIFLLAILVHSGDGTTTGSLEACFMQWRSFGKVIFSMAGGLGLPLLTELIVECGLQRGIISFCKNFPFVTLFHLFQAQTKHCAFTDSVITGNAQYRKTGRNLGNQHETLVEIYQNYAYSHFHISAATLAMMLIAFAGTSFSGGSSWLPFLSLFSLLFAPILFNPFPSFEKALKSLEEFLHWTALIEEDFFAFWFQKDCQRVNGARTFDLCSNLFQLLVWLSLVAVSYHSLGSWMLVLLSSWFLFLVTEIMIPAHPRTLAKGDSSTFSLIINSATKMIIGEKAPAINNADALGGSIRLLHLIGTAVALSVTLAVSTAHFGIGLALWQGLIALLLFCSVLSCLRFVLLYGCLSPSTTEAHAQYRIISRVTWDLPKKWLIAVTWGFSATFVAILWAPFSSLFLFNRAVWQQEFKRQSFLSASKVGLIN